MFAMVFCSCPQCRTGYLDWVKDLVWLTWTQSKGSFTACYGELNKEGNAQPSFAQGGLWNKNKKRWLEEGYLFNRSSSSQRMTESVILLIGWSQALHSEVYGTFQEKRSRGEVFMTHNYSFHKLYFKRLNDSLSKTPNCKPAENIELLCKWLK
jgi:hypothetical protein